MENKKDVKENRNSETKNEVTNKRKIKSNMNTKIKETEKKDTCPIISMKGITE